jgi:hypothetical protein
MSRLNAERVKEIMIDSLFTDEEAPPDHDMKEGDFIVGEGLLGKFGFHPVRLESHREEIKGMLEDLSDRFKESSGGGASFLEACDDKDGVQWGEHQDMNSLFALGTALGLVVYPLPRALWDVLPGGVPYVTVKV